MIWKFIIRFWTTQYKIYKVCIYDFKYDFNLGFLQSYARMQLKSAIIKFFDLAIIIIKSKNIIIIIFKLLFMFNFVTKVRYVFVFKEVNFSIFPQKLKHTFMIVKIHNLSSLHANHAN